MACMNVQQPNCPLTSPFHNMEALTADIYRETLKHNQFSGSKLYYIPLPGFFMLV